MVIEVQWNIGLSFPYVSFSLIRHSISVVPEQILFYTGLCIVASTLPWKRVKHLLHGNCCLRSVTCVGGSHKGNTKDSCWGSNHSG
jgi:hypothetical protein